MPVHFIESFFSESEGTSEYTDCPGLLDESSSTWPETAVFQIAANGVPMDKLVIGKPAGVGDANNGQMPAETLATCLAEAKERGWNGGAMVWQVRSPVPMLLSLDRVNADLRPPAIVPQRPVRVDQDGAIAVVACVKGMYAMEVACHIFATCCTRIILIVAVVFGYVFVLPDFGVVPCWSSLS